MGSTAATSKHHIRLKDFVTWFEIPVWDINRAATFYNTIYSMEMEVGFSGDFAMAYFPADKGIGGALIAGPGCTPNDTGVLIYLNTGNDLDSVLRRVPLAGGRIIMQKTLISEAAGYFALFIDSEGNRLALHEGPARANPRTNEAIKPATKAAPKKAASKQASPKPAKKK
jgi:predicted enzyme related to lactoylglutathione lyase